MFIPILKHHDCGDSTCTADPTSIMVGVGAALFTFLVFLVIILLICRRLFK